MATFAPQIDPVPIPIPGVEPLRAPRKFGLLKQLDVGQSALVPCDKASLPLARGAAHYYGKRLGRSYVTRTVLSADGVVEGLRVWRTA